MFNRIARRYDATNRAMSVGVDVRWRKQAIARLIEGAGETPLFLDLGAGTLDGALEIARRVPGARVAAADFAREMLVAGKPKVKDGAPHRFARRRRPSPALPRRRVRRRVLRVLHPQPRRSAARAARAPARGPPGRPRRAARVPAPGAPAPVHRSHLERPRVAADRPRRQRRSRRLPLPARFDRPLPLARRAGGAAAARSASATVETKALFPSGVATMVVAS